MTVDQLYRDVLKLTRLFHGMIKELALVEQRLAKLEKADKKQAK
jgi:hypothetical protein